jgi:hypothetical protein
LQHQLPMIFARSRPTLLLSQLLADKIESPTPLNLLDSVT